MRKHNDDKSKLLANVSHWFHLQSAEIRNDAGSIECIRFVCTYNRQFASLLRGEGTNDKSISAVDLTLVDRSFEAFRVSLDLYLSIFLA